MRHLWKAGTSRQDVQGPRCKLLPNSVNDPPLIPSTLPKCWTCGARDEHESRDCPINITCWNCGRRGHASAVSSSHRYHIVPRRLIASAVCTELHGAKGTKTMSTLWVESACAKRMVYHSFLCSPLTYDPIHPELSKSLAPILVPVGEKARRRPSAPFK